MAENILEKDLSFFFGVSENKKPDAFTPSRFPMSGRDDRIRTDGLLLPKQTR